MCVCVLLLTPVCLSLSLAQVLRIFNTIYEFIRVQDALFDVAAREDSARDATEAAMEANTAQGRWGDEGLDGVGAGSEEKGRAAGRGVAKLVVQFHEHLDGCMEQLLEARADDGLKRLRFRLDYNGYYEKKRAQAMHDYRMAQDWRSNRYQA